MTQTSGKPFYNSLKRLCTRKRKKRDFASIGEVTTIVKLSKRESANDFKVNA